MHIAYRIRSPPPERHCLTSARTLHYVIMIWLGRLLSIPFGITFFGLLLLALIILQGNDTFLDPDFYPAELRKANAYEFALQDVLTSGLDEYRQIQFTDDDGNARENFLVTSGLTT